MDDINPNILVEESINAMLNIRPLYGLLSRIANGGIQIVNDRSLWWNRAIVQQADDYVMIAEPYEGSPALKQVCKREIK